MMSARLDVSTRVMRIVNNRVGGKRGRDVTFEHAGPLTILQAGLSINVPHNPIISFYFFFYASNKSVTLLLITATTTAHSIDVEFPHPDPHAWCGHSSSYSSAILPYSYCILTATKLAATKK